MEGGKSIWAFESSGAGQISTTEGQSLHVLARDNSEWWYIRTDDGEGYVPASYVQLESAGDEGASDAGSVASAQSSAASSSAASTQSSLGSTASPGSLTRFMKSAHGRKKRQQVQQAQPTQQHAQSSGAEAPTTATVSAGGSGEASTDAAGKLQQLKQEHDETVAKMKAESEQRSMAHEAEVRQLRDSLREAEAQHELDQLELKATHAALAAAEDAASATRQANEHLNTVAIEHAQTEKRLREEIVSLRSQLDRSRGEVERLRSASVAVKPSDKLDKTTTAAQAEPNIGAAAATSRITGNGSSARPQSAPVDRTCQGRSATSQPRWTALGASETEPPVDSQTDVRRPTSSNGRGSGTASRQHRRKVGRIARQTNMRPQSAPSRHSVALSELSTTMLPGNPPELQAMRAQRRRHYSKPPPNGAKIVGVGLGAAAFAAAKQRQPSDATAGQAYALMAAASEFLENEEQQSSYQEEVSGPSELMAHDSPGPSAAASRHSAVVAAKHLQEFEDRVASLLTAPGSRKRPTAPAKQAAVWARLQKVG